MVADIARVTYDPGRQYRAVVRQQGRVTLEADSNEASAIAVRGAAAGNHRHLRPDRRRRRRLQGGSGRGPGGDQHQSGHLLSRRLAAEARCAGRSGRSSPIGSTPRQRPSAVATMVVALLLTEQSVSAVEDQALARGRAGRSGQRGTRPADAALPAYRRKRQHLRRRCQHDRGPPRRGRASASIRQPCGSSPQPRLQAGFVPGPPVTDPARPRRPAAISAPTTRWCASRSPPMTPPPGPARCCGAGTTRRCSIAPPPPTR